MYHVAFLGSQETSSTWPVGILSRALHNESQDEPDRMFVIEVVTEEVTTRAVSSLTFETELVLADVLDRITEYNCILSVPGTPRSIIQELVESETLELELIRTFAIANSSRPHIFLPVCGCLFTSAARILLGLIVTTHHHALDNLQELSSIFRNQR